MPGMDQTRRGIQAIKGKNQWWADNHEIHGGTVKGPFPNGDPLHPTIQVRCDTEADRKNA